MKYADRVQAIEPAAPFVISNLVAELKETSDDIIDLSVGQPDFDPPPTVIEATKRALDSGKTTYTPSHGIPELRRAIATYLQERFDLDYSAENIIVTPGGKMALYETVQALVNSGEEVILFDPVWSSYEPMVTLAGGRTVHIDLSPYDFQLEPALDTVLEAVSSETALMMINSPTNPSGKVYSSTAFEGIRDIAVDYDIPVVSDEIYAELIFDGDQRSLATYEGMYDRTITINGFSKTFSMTGFRLGFLAAPIEHTTQAGKVHSHSVSCASHFVQHAGITALKRTDIDEFTQRMLDRFEYRRDVLVTEFIERGIEIAEPDGAFYVMIPIDTDDDMSWCKEVLNDVGVGLVPGSAFGTPGYVRASLVDTADRIREAIVRLEDGDHI